jgi:hypothetical protein
MKLYNNDGCYKIIKYFKSDNGSICIIAERTGWFIDYIGDETNITTPEENYERAYQFVINRIGKDNLTLLDDKQVLLEYIDKEQEPNNNKNIMGCLEDWYDPFYAIKQTFTREQVENMTDVEISNLFSLAINISDGLY